MKTVVDELRLITHEFVAKMDQISEIEFSAKLAANRWSKKEILGHLIDSAQNNLRRFITCQYESTPPKIVYNQDFCENSNKC